MSQPAKPWCRLLWITAALALVANAQAQSGGSFQIISATIDTGANVSSGGQFRVAGTVGQPDAGLLSGGRYTLAGGFWAQLIPVDSPTLSIRVSGGQVTLSWPAGSALQLAEAASMAGVPALWSLIAPAGYQTVGTNLNAVLPLRPGTRFYRLQQP